MGGGGGTGNFTFGDEQDVPIQDTIGAGAFIGGGNVASDGSTATAVQQTQNQDDAVIVIAIPNP